VQSAVKDFVVQIADQVVSSRFDDDEHVLLDVSSGLYYVLDGAGGFLWGLWKSNVSVAASIEQLVEAFDVERAEAEADVLALLEQLSTNGLVAPSSPADAALAP
jgi:hypothetical protein